MSSADNQCLLRECWSTVSTTGSSLLFSTRPNSTSSPLVIPTASRPLPYSADYGLYSSLWTTNAIKWWVTSEGLPRKKLTKNTKTHQKQGKFLMDTDSGSYLVRTISGRPSDGWHSHCWQETTRHTCSPYFQWCRWLNGQKTSTEDTRKNSRINTQRTVQRCSPSSSDSDWWSMIKRYLIIKIIRCK